MGLIRELKQCFIVERHTKSYCYVLLACEPLDILCRILCKSKYTLLWGEGSKFFVGFSQYVCVIQNRLKTIVYAPVICADVIPGVGTLPKTQELHYV